jgi:hypothetical protein
LMPAARHAKMLHRNSVDKKNSFFMGVFFVATKVRL